ncbi:MAG: hypothetical protein IKN00_08575 [Bacteroidales bacterium]|nr:hypothetical protein [Bacteroidales bacterium]
MLYRKDKHGDELSILGYGCMRFSRKGTGVGIEKTEQELLAADRALLPFPIKPLVLLLRRLMIKKNR